MDPNKAVEWLLQNWQQVAELVALAAMVALYLRKLGQEKVAQMLGHIVMRAMQTAIEEARLELGQVPVEDIRGAVGEMYDVFVNRLPPVPKALVLAMCSREQALELAEKVWRKYALMGAALAGK